MRITAETCPHYLALAAEDVPDGATEYKCCPPIRERANAERLWEALRDGVIDCVVSDHSPCPPELKRRAGGDFGAAWGGISSVQLACRWSGPRPRRAGFRSTTWPAGWRRARRGWPGWPARARSRRATTPTWSRSRRRKASWSIPARLYHRHPLTPYAGRAARRGGAADLAARPAGVRRRARPAGGCWPGGSAADRRASGAARFRRPARPGLPSARRQRGGRQRRAVRREGEPDQAGAAGLRARRRTGCGARSTTAGRRGGAGRAGHDHAIVRLGVPGIVHGVVVDTSFFRGNYPPQVSVEAVQRRGLPVPGRAGRAGLANARAADRRAGRHGERVPRRQAGPRWTHVRLSIYPDGGVARLRVHGEPLPDPRFLTGTFDLAALENGGRVTGCSDAFYSSAGNLIMPGRARAWPRAGRTRAGATRGTTTWSSRWPRPAPPRRDRHLLLRRQRPGPGPAAGRRRRGAGGRGNTRRRGARCCR